MKNMMGLCVFVLFTLLMTSTSFGVKYDIDFLETGNPGGWSDSLKTFEDEYPVREGRTVDVDIWLTDLPEELITAGFQMEYDASLISITGCTAYDGSLPGPWDGDMTTIVANPSGSGMYAVIVGNLGCVAPDAGGGIPIARITVEGVAQGAASMTLRPIEGFDTVVGDSATVYDSAITPAAAVITIEDGGLCVAEAIYGAHAEETEFLRNYRDMVLSETRAGQELISMYYYWSPALVKLLQDEKMKAGIKTMLGALLPLMRWEVNKRILPR